MKVCDLNTHFLTSVTLTMVKLIGRELDDPSLSPGDSAGPSSLYPARVPAHKHAGDSGTMGEHSLEGERSILKHHGTWRGLGWKDEEGRVHRHEGLAQGLLGLLQASARPPLPRGGHQGRAADSASGLPHPCTPGKAQAHKSPHVPMKFTSPAAGGPWRKPCSTDHSRNNPSVAGVPSDEQQTGYEMIPEPHGDEVKERVSARKPREQGARGCKEGESQGLLKAEHHEERTRRFWCHTLTSKKLNSTKNQQLSFDRSET